MKRKKPRVHCRIGDVQAQKVDLIFRRAVGSHFEALTPELPWNVLVDEALDGIDCSAEAITDSQLRSSD
ncbi:hypothetical protein PtrEW13061_011392 [Pyrenophora tritici-repentis]|nr:hypothetical protein PtrEW13061_011392 [Pyrenophora tritici-repentis]